MKICICCGRNRPKSDYYRHPQMGDGTLGKCRGCCRTHAREHRLKRLAENPQRYGDQLNATKKCKKCGEVKPVDSFYFKEVGKLNRRAECTTCFNATWKLRNPEKSKEARRRWVDRNPQRKKIHQAVDSAVKSGRLKKPRECSACGEEHGRIHGHHDDYSEPLKVRWLCPRCHGLEHRKMFNETGMPRSI